MELTRKLTSASAPELAVRSAIEMWVCPELGSLVMDSVTGDWRTGDEAAGAGAKANTGAKGAVAATGGGIITAAELCLLSPSLLAPTMLGPSAVRLSKRHWKRSSPIGPSGAAASVGAP